MMNYSIPYEHKARKEKVEQVGARSPNSFEIKQLN
jgi:hypothetical protein